MSDMLHRKRIFYRIAVLVWRCLLGIAVVYLQELCRPVSTLVGHRAPRSCSGGRLLLVCKHLDYTALCILGCYFFYLEFTSFTDSIVTKELHTLLYKLLKA